jgi:hypothetical protein
LAVPWHGHGAGWGVPDADFGGGPMPVAKTTLDDVIEDTGARTIHYLYDFGDNHVIKIERIADLQNDPDDIGRLVAEPARQARYPQLVAGEGRCPPEDVGGAPGYAEFLAAIADPTHEEHEHMLTLCGGDYDPETPDVDRIAAELD